MNGRTNDQTNGQSKEGIRTVEPIDTGICEFRICLSDQFDRIVIRMNAHTIELNNKRMNGRTNERTNVCMHV